jgi:hypothetical protein
MTGAAAEDEPVTPVTQAEELLDQDRPRRERTYKEYSLDGHPVRAAEPKNAVLVRIEMGLGSTDPQRIIEAVEEFIDSAFDEPSADHITARLEDEDDLDFDYDSVAALYQKLSTVWGSTQTTGTSGRRPTGRTGGSSRRSPRTTRGSKAKSR